MLVLTRKIGDGIRLEGPNGMIAEVYVSRSKKQSPNYIKLAIDAPKDVQICRIDKTGQSVVKKGIGKVAAWLLVLLCHTSAWAQTTTTIPSITVCTKSNCGQGGRAAVVGYPPGGMEAWFSRMLSASPTSTATSSSTSTSTSTTSSTSTTTSITSTTCPNCTGGGDLGWVDQGDRLKAVKPVAVPQDFSVEQGVSPSFTFRGWEFQQGIGLIGKLSEIRGWPLKVGQMVCGENGDVYEVIQITGDGRTGWHAVPPATPIVRRPDWDLPANAIVYPGWAGRAKPGWQYRTIGACTTSSLSRVPEATWCSTIGCTMQDGTCTYRGEPMGAPQFLDGEVTFKLTGQPDAYACSEQLRIGSQSPNQTGINAMIGDNIYAGRTIQFPGVAGDEWGLSHADIGNLMTAREGNGDERLGRPTFEYAGPFDQRIAEWSAAANIDPPQIRLKLNLEPGGTWPVGEAQEFSATYRDGRYKKFTAISPRSRKIIPSLGMQKIKICMPEDANFKWPLGGGRAQVGVCRGNSKWWGNLVTMLLVPGECVTLDGPESIWENSTCGPGSMTGKPAFSISNLERQDLTPVWGPNRPGIQAWRSRVRGLDPTKKTLSEFVAAKVGCTSPCQNCATSALARGTTGAVEPLWYQSLPGMLGFVADNDVCWMELPISQAAIVVDESLLITTGTANGPRPAIRMTKDAIEFFDLTAPNPLTVQKSYTRLP